MYFYVLLWTCECTYRQVYLIIAVLDLYPASAPPTKWGYFEENHYKAILSYNIVGSAKELYFHIVKTPSLIRHSMENNKQMILRNEKR